MRDTAGEVGTISKGMYSHGPLHMDEQRQDDQLEPKYSSSVPIRDVTLKTFRKQRTIGRGGERGSGISVRTARRDDDDDSVKYCLYLNYILNINFSTYTYILVVIGSSSCNSFQQKILIQIL